VLNEFNVDSLKSNTAIKSKNLSHPHLCTLLLDPQERLRSNFASYNYLPSCPRVTQNYLQQPPVTWRCLHCALSSVGILYNYTYSTDYHRQLQNSSYHFRITPLSQSFSNGPSVRIPMLVLMTVLDFNHCLIF
jgi:hypothetical protein